jgi:hypothetical protein
MPSENDGRMEAPRVLAAIVDEHERRQGSGPVP